MIKRILKIWFIIGMYELSKYLTNELIVKLQSVDDVEVPQDFTQDDHIHLNAEVSGANTFNSRLYIGNRRRSIL